MLDIKFIRENPDFVAESAKNKRSNVDIKVLLALDDLRLQKLSVVESLRTEQNKISNEIGITKDALLRNQMINDMRLLKEDLKKKEEGLEETMKEWQAMMIKIPNIATPDTPVGPDESSNVVIRTWGEKPVFDFTPKEHFEIGEALGIIDSET